jgi:hypothetical protein
VTSDDDNGTDAVGEGADDTTDDGSPGGAASGSGADGDRTVSVLGVDIVVEEAFATFPWRAGMLRAPLAVGLTVLGVFLVAFVNGFGDGSLLAALVYVVLVVYGLHNIPVMQAAVPGFLEGVAETLIGIPYLRGFVLYGRGHGNPPQHVFDILTGKTESIGHFTILPSNPEIPLVVYGAIPMVVLVAVGYEFAASYWDEVTIDSGLEVFRFGVAIALGYAAVLFVGTFFVSQVTMFGVLIPDRYMTLIFGLGYPFIFASVGAGLVYVQRRVLSDQS